MGEKIKFEMGPVLKVDLHGAHSIRLVKHFAYTHYKEFELDPDGNLGSYRDH